MQPAPNIDEQTGERFYSVEQAAQIVGAISAVTLGYWAKHGSTPFGFELDVKRQPTIHDPRGYRHEAKTHRQFRLLIPESRVLALKEILNAEPRRPGPISRDDMEALEAAARRFPLPLRQHPKNSPTPS